MPRARAVPPHPERSAVREITDAAGDAEARHAAEPQAERHGSPRQEKPARAARTASVLAEDIRGEAIDLRAPGPAIRRQASLGARVREKRLAIPAQLRGDLRQQQSAAPSLFDYQAVTANLDRVRIHRIDWFQRTEDGDLHVKVIQLGRAHRLEP